MPLNRLSPQAANPNRKSHNHRTAEMPNLRKEKLMFDHADGSNVYDIRPGTHDQQCGASNRESSESLLQTTIRAKLGS